jgi:hypothetical protein
MVTTIMGQLEWNGKSLGKGRLAMTVLTKDEPAGPDSPTLILAAACNGHRTHLLRPEQVGDFLRTHAEAQIACYDLDSFFWPIENYLRSSGDWGGRQALLDAAHGCRLHDIRLLYQLLFDALFDAIPPELKDLRQLASAYTIPETSVEAEGDPSGEERDDSEKATEGTLESRTVQEAQLILNIYLTQQKRAGELVERLRVPLELVHQFGPLAVGLQGQGAIALGRAARNGLHLRKDAAPELRQLCDQIYSDCSHQLFRDLRVRRCFHWFGDKVKPTARGLPDEIKSELRPWLEEMIASTPSTFNIPLEPPRTPEGQISTIPELWSDLVLVRPELRAWARLWAAAKSRKALDESINRDPSKLRPRYALFPRLISMAPNLEQIRRLGFPAMFEAEPGHSLLVGRFPDLILRCHAEVCERTGGQSQLGGLFRGEVDPVHYVARSLYGRHMAADMNDDMESWEVDEEQELARFRFEEIDEQDPGKLEYWKKLARALLDVVPRGLGAAHARELLSRDYGIEVDPGEAERYWNQIVFILPDLGWVVDEDQTFAIVRRKFGCEAAELADELVGETAESSMAALRNLISGRTRSPAAFAKLRAICREPHWQEQLATGEGSYELNKDLFGQNLVSPVGRVRRGVFLTEARAAQHLDLAEDALKAAMFGLVAAGFELVAFAAGEFVIQVAEESPREATIRRVEAVAEQAAKRVVIIFPPRCETHHVTVW